MTLSFSFLVLIVEQSHAAPVQMDVRSGATVFGMQKSGDRFYTIWKQRLSGNGPCKLPVEDRQASDPATWSSTLASILTRSREPSYNNCDDPRTPPPVGIGSTPSGGRGGTRIPPPAHDDED